MNLSYDYIVVGAGPAGCSIARLLVDSGKKVKIIESSQFVGGTARTALIGGIQIHVNGPHIFHTSDNEVWDFMNKFSEMTPFVNSPIANYHGKLYNLPFNLNTFYQISEGNVKTPNDVKSWIESEISSYSEDHPDFDRNNPKNLEEKAISMVGTTIFNYLVKEYTEKQWGKKCSELPMSTINRLPVRLTFDNNYFNDIYQGIPKNGYSELFRNMIKDIDCEFGINVNKRLIDYILRHNSKIKIIYTGAVDKLYNYKFGKMPFRSLRFQHEYITNVNNYQGVAVMNFTSDDVDYTRITEHRHFNRNCNSDETWITFEYPENNVTEDSIPYYPIQNDFYEDYTKQLNQEYSGRVLLAGRAGLWRYLDMDKIIRESFNLVLNLAK